MQKDHFDLVVVGSGLSGAVIAHKAAFSRNKKVLILEKREHLGGNCFDSIDPKTNVLWNRYGAHLFHTNDEKVWEFIQSFATWVPWEHHVLASIKNALVPIPINRLTINKLYSLNLSSEKEAQRWLEAKQKKITHIDNSEEHALNLVGQELFSLFYEGYTLKQWGCPAEKLDPSVLARIPVRYNEDSRYFTDKYQALPKEGYTHFFKNLLKHPNITIKLNTPYQSISLPKVPLVFTGPIDQYFSSLPKLRYRSLSFHIERYYNTAYYQKNSVINFPDIETPYTRSVEYKHFLNQKSSHTIVVKESSQNEGEPYYPFPDKENQALYKKYQILATKEEKEKHVFFVGRLANYKYFNMDQAIKNALLVYEEKIDPLLRAQSVMCHSKV